VVERYALAALVGRQHCQLVVRRAAAGQARERASVELAGRGPVLRGAVRVELAVPGGGKGRIGGGGAIRGSKVEGVASSAKILLVVC
jgi:hypothetical protein